MLIGLSAAWLLGLATDGLATWSMSAPQARDVEVIWDLTATDARRLSIVVTIEPGTPDTIAGAKAYGFLFRETDRVVISFKWRAAASVKGEVSYAVSGTNVDHGAIEAFKKLVSDAAPEVDMARVNSVAGAPRSETKAVSDELIAGGKLTITCLLKERQGNGEVILYASGGITFRIEGRPPRISVSNGLAISRAPDPSVAIVKTSTILTFQKDGKPQQAYQQMILLRDKEARLQPLQTLVTYANFQLRARMYATLGVQLNQKIFEEPLLGFSYRQPLVGTMGLHFFGGAHFTRETALVDGSGFTDEMRLDQAVGLTVDDIPTTTRRRARAVFGLSLSF